MFLVTFLIFFGQLFLTNRALLKFHRKFPFIWIFAVHYLYLSIIICRSSVHHLYIICTINVQI